MVEIIRGSFDDGMKYAVEQAKKENLKIIKDTYTTLEGGTHLGTVIGYMDGGMFYRWKVHNAPFGGVSIESTMISDSEITELYDYLSMIEAVPEDMDIDEYKWIEKVMEG